MCKNGPAGAFSNQRSSFFHGKVDCGSWDCPTCKAKKQKEWLTHLSNATKDNTLHSAEIPKAEWKTTYRTLPKTGWYKVEANQGKSLLIVAITEFQNSTPTSRKQATKDTRNALAALARPNNTKKWVPVATCRAWKQGTNQPTYKFIAWINKKDFLNQLANNITKVLDRIDSMIVSIKTGEFENCVQMLIQTNIAKKSKSSISDNRKQQQEHDDFWHSIFNTQPVGTNKVPTLSG